MLHRALPRALALAVLLLCGFAASAHASSATTWEPVAQLAEGNQNPSYQASDGERGDLLAIHYDFQSDGRVNLRWRVASNLLADTRVVTALDMDRDGIPDIAVDMKVRIASHSGSTNQPYTIYPLAGSGTTASCLVLPSTGGHTGTTQATDDGDYWTRVTVSELAGTFASGNLATLERYAPRIAAFQVRSDTGAELDAIPVAAKSSTRCGTGNAGWSLDFTKAVDRAPATAVVGGVTHDDPADDAPSAFADLTRVAAAPHTATVPDGDVVDGTATTKTIHPTDLAIDFAPGSTGRSTITYLWPETWANGDSHQSPDATIVTDSSGSAVRVKIYRGLSRIGGAPEDGNSIQCEPTPTGPAQDDIILPTQTVGSGAGAHERLTIVLDSILLGTPAFRFHTISDPGGDGGQIDHVPFLAGLPKDPTSSSPVAVGCSGGAEVYEDRSFTAGVTQPTATLTASKTNPGRDENVTFTATSNAGEKRCSLGQTLAWDGCTALTKKFTADATAYLAAYNPDGSWNEAEVPITIANTPPTATITKTSGGSPAGTDGSYASVGGAAVTVPLHGAGIDIDNDTVTYAWKRNGVAASTSQDYTPSFTTPGTYTITLTTSDGTDTTTTTLSIVVVRSPSGDVSITRPARVIAGQPFNIAAAVAASGHQALSWNWDLDGDAATNYDATHTTQTLTNVVIPTANPAYPVRVRATDAGGRTGVATLTLNVRRPNEAPPAASFEVTPASGRQSGQALHFDGSASRLSDPDGALQGPVGQSPSNVLFHWDFGDGTPAQTTTTASVDHVYAGSGEVTASLVVEDARATPTTSSDPATKALSIAPGASDANAPKARIARQDPADGKPVFVNRDVTLSAAASTAATGHDPLKFTWDTDGDGTYETDTGAQPQVTFKPAKAGSLAVSVKATDRFGSSATAGLTLAVSDEPVKVPTVQLAGPATVTLTGASVAASYDATGSKGENLDPSLTYRWDADGNGSFETSTGTTPKLDTSFSTSGAKTVTVQATDVYGNVATKPATTTVRSPADIANNCPGVTSFQSVSYANVRVRGCAQSVARPSAGPLYLFAGSVRVNGLDLVPGAGSSPAPKFNAADCASQACRDALADYLKATQFQVAVDPSDGSMRSNRDATFKAVGSGLDIPLSKGDLNTNLPSGPTNAISFGTPDGDIGGFPITGSVSISFPAPGETSIALTVGLPKVLEGFTGGVTLRATNGGGVQLDELRIGVGEVKIGKKLKLGELSFLYNRPENLWRGGAQVTLPSPRPIGVGVQVAVQNNQFKSINGEVFGLNQPIAQAIYLQAIRLGVAVDPLDLSGGITLTAGPAVEGKSVLSLDGDIHLRFPSPAANYYLFELTGKLSLADFQLATAYAQFTSNGYFAAGGGIDLDVGIAYLKAYVSGWITSNAFNFDADAEVGVKLGGIRYGLAGAHATLSTTGVAACGEIPVLDIGGGFGARWGQSFDAFWGCDLSPYRATKPADAPEPPTFGDDRAASGYAFGAMARSTSLLRTPQIRAVNGQQGHLLQIPANTEKALLTVHGQGAPPRVTIVDEKGTVVLDTPADGSDALTQQMLVQSKPDDDTTQVLWKAPPAGKLYLLEQAGSAAVTGVDMALPTPDRKITTKVSGSGYDRTLSWNVTPALEGGQSLTLAEEGAAAGTELAVTTKSSGSVRFTPQGGKQGKRSITATLVTSGLPATPKTVGSYVAPPPPVPVKPAVVRVERSRSAAVVHWTRGLGSPAANWNALVEVNGEGRKQMLSTGPGRRALKISNITPSDTVKVTVTGVSARDIEGPGRSATLQPGLRWSDGRGGKLGTATPRRVRVRRGSTSAKVTWSTGGAFLKGFDVRVTAGGKTTLLRSASNDRSVVVKGLPRRGSVRVTVSGRRYDGKSTPVARGHGV